jgi:hypothetical protein
MLYAVGRRILGSSCLLAAYSGSLPFEDMPSLQKEVNCQRKNRSESIFSAQRKGQTACIRN